MHIWGIFSAVTAVSPEQVREMADNTEGRILLVKILALTVCFAVYAVRNIKKYKVGNVNNHIFRDLAKKHGSASLDRDRIVRLYAEFLQLQAKINKQKISYKEALGISQAKAVEDTRRIMRRGSARNSAHGSDASMHRWDTEQQRFMQESLTYASDEALKAVTPFDYGGYVQGDGFNPSDTMAADDLRHQMDSMNSQMNNMGGMGMF